MIKYLKDVKKENMYGCLLFLFSLGLFIAFINFDKVPVKFPDSTGYIRFGEDMILGELGHTLKRTPVYPMYLFPFLLMDSLNLAIIGQVVLGAASITLLYLVLLKLTPRPTIALLLAAFLSFDYGVAQYQQTVLSETIAIFILMAFIYINILLYEKSSTKVFFASFIGGVILVFAKPIFIVFPMATYIVNLLHTFYDKNKKIRSRGTLFLVTGIILNLLIVVAYSSLNYYRYDKFQFSMVSDINMTGKIIQYGYLDEEYDSLSPAAKALQETYFETGRKISPYVPLNKIYDEENGIMGERLATVNSYFLKGHYKDYIGKTKDLIKTNFGVVEVTYAEKNKLIKSEPFNTIIDLFERRINKWYYVAFIVSLLIGMYFFFRRDKKSITLLLLSMCVFYVILFSSAFSHSEYSRLTIPSKYLQSVLVIYPIFYFVENGIQYIKRYTTRQKKA